MVRVNGGEIESVVVRKQEGSHAVSQLRDEVVVVAVVGERGKRKRHGGLEDEDEDEDE